MPGAWSVAMSGPFPEVAPLLYLCLGCPKKRYTSVAEKTSEVCQDFGHYAARKSLPSSILLLKSAITSAGCLYPIDECGRRRL